MKQFIKTLAYQPYGNEDVFNYVRKLLLQEIDPPSTAQASIISSAPKLLHSPLRRVAETVDIAAAQTRVVLRDLREVSFDIKAFLNEDQLLKEGSTAIRKAFIQAFVEDRLHVSRAMLAYEITGILDIVYAEEEVDVVSHSFRLKLIEAFLCTNGKVFVEPALITRFIDPKEKTYRFGEVALKLNINNVLI